MNPVFKKFRQDIVAVSFLAAGLFVALSLLSYNPLDPSLNSIGNALKSNNYCGLVGSFLSDLLYQAFGLAIWIPVLGLFRLAWTSFSGEVFTFKNTRLVWALLLLLNVSALLSLYLPETKLFQNQIFPGGLVGLGLSQGLVRAFNPIGVQVLLWSLTIILVVFYSERPLQEWLRAPRERLRTQLMVPLVWWRNRKTKQAQNKPVADQVGSRAPSKGGLFQLRQTNEAKVGLEIATAAAPTKPLQLELDEAQEKSEGLPPSHQQEELDVADLLPPARRRVILKAKPPKRIENWKMPGISLLEDPPASRFKLDREELRRKAELLMQKLQMFKIDGQIVDAKPGPLVTMYEFKPNPDVKISEISNLEDDLSLALSSESVRVMGQIPGTDVVGIETANSRRETVFYKDLLAEDKFWKDDIALPLALGKQANGDPKIENLRAMPHLLIAGTTGSGKSVFVRSIICGLLFRHSPKTLRLILIDPKMVDLADFKDVPHLILPHVTEPKKAVTALRWAVKEMDKRYRSLSRFGAAKIEGFNEKVSRLSSDELAEHEKNNQEDEQQTGSGEAYYYQPLPYIVVIVDELADLMVTEKQNIEPSIQRLAQKARACGIHLIFATQTPRKEVVTGLIKSNFPGRVALKVSSPLDSRIILEETGAERLLPNGDMLFLAPGVNKPARQHGPYMSDQEIQSVVQFWSTQSAPEFDPVGLKMLEGPSGGLDGQPLQGAFSEDEAGEEYDLIVKWTAEQKSVSASMLQRRFSIGYPKAARFIEIMERNGVVSAPNGSKPRQVLVSSLK